MTAHDARRPIAASIVTLTIALIVAACGSATASVAPSATATAIPTAVPTPSPSPVDVAAAFVKHVAAPTFSATATVTGSMEIGAVEGDLSGNGVISGPNSSMTLAITAGAFEQVTDTVTVGGTSWTRTSPGPWLEDPAKQAGETDSSLGEILKSVVSVVDLGVETRGGNQLHHLQAKGGNEVPGDAFGVDTTANPDARFTLDFYATDDGTPAVMAIAGGWTQTSGSVKVPTSMTFDIAFSDIGKPQVINPPEDVWVRFTSKPLGYTMAHPSEWTVESEADVDTYLLNGQGYVYVAVTPYKGSTAKFAGELKASYKKPFKGDPESETPTTLGGQPAVRLIYQYTDDQDQGIVVADDVVSRDGTGWEVFLRVAGGPEDIEFFDQFVATFQFTE